MGLFESLTSARDFILELVFPAFCAGCGREETYLCPDCRKKISLLQIQRCVVCQKPSPFGRTHTDCAKTKLDGLISALAYRDPLVKDLIGLLKYKFVDISGALSGFVLEEISNQELGRFFLDFELVAVPLHKRRLRWRGFNQSELVAQHLSAALKIPIFPCVERTMATKPQVELSQEQRKANIKGAFILCAPVAGKKLLLVDDVVTSGSTLNELARILKKGKAAAVWAVTIAAD